MTSVPAHPGLQPFSSDRSLDLGRQVSAPTPECAGLATSVQPAGWEGYDALISRPVERQGVLHKQSSKEPTQWRRLHFLLHEGELRYAASEADVRVPTASKVIRLDTVDSLRMVGENCLQLAFQRSTKHVVLRAENGDEMKDWLFSFHLAVATVVLRILAAHDEAEMAVAEPATPRMAMMRRASADATASFDLFDPSSIGGRGVHAQERERSESGDSVESLGGLQPPLLMSTKSSMHQHHIRAADAAREPGRPAGRYVPPAMRARMAAEAATAAAVAVVEEEAAAAPVGRWVPPSQRRREQAAADPLAEDEGDPLFDFEEPEMEMEMELGLEEDEPAAPVPEPEAPKGRVGVAEECGCRSSMEDACLVLDAEGERLLAGSLSVLGVFDGHAGRRAADAVVQLLPLELEAEAAALAAGDLEGALQRCFARVDATFLADARENDWGDGCTGVVALLTEGGRIVVANTGDSRAVLCVDGAAVEMSSPHSPGVEVERARIEAANGWVTEERELQYSRLHHMDLRSSEIRSKAKEVVRWLSIHRVNGDLAVSRAFGDMDYKGAGMAAFQWNFPEGHSQTFTSDLVIVDPEIREEQRGADTEFLLLACDGVWDVIEPAGAVEHVRGLMHEGPQAAAASLVQLALRLGSNDNVTVLVVDLSPGP